MFTIRRRLLALGLLFICSIHGHAQDSTANAQKTSLKDWISSKQYRFHAQSATSQRGKTIQLTSDYFLLVNGDSLQLDLPYYGRAYTSSYGSSDVSLRFKSNQFSYSMDTTKKGGWEITIVPKNEQKASKIYISTGASGYTSINVMSNTRQPISYYGTIEELKK